MKGSSALKRKCMLICRISAFYISRCCVGVFLEASLTHWTTVRISVCGMSAQCVNGRKQDSAFSYPYFQKGDEIDTKLEVTCSVLFVWTGMAQHVQLQWCAFCHYSRQTCWTPISVGGRSVAWKYLLFHLCTELHFQYDQEPTRCFMTGDTEF